MTSYIALVLALLAQGAQEHPKLDGAKGAHLIPGVGNVRHAVKCCNADSQTYFNQGLALIYAFNHDEAGRSFQRAIELCPENGMAWWGVALALGPNINLDVDPDREKQAYEAVQNAVAMKATLPQQEQDYIDALAKRYSIDPKADLRQLQVDYKNAMGELAKKYPDDPDAQALYAESIMDLHPWKLWSKDGKLNEGTEEAIHVLEAVLRRTPDHIGANHYYIHCMEASPWPERALSSARRLAYLAPACGHLVHMPSHIYIRTGDFAQAVIANDVALKADKAYFDNEGIKNFYPMYYVHNFDMKRHALSMSGRGKEAIQTATDELEFATPMIEQQMPAYEFMFGIKLLMQARFHKWGDIIASKPPAEKYPLSFSTWHYVRGLAFAGNGETDAAKAERTAMAEWIKKIGQDAISGLGSAGDVIAVMQADLDAAIARSAGDMDAELGARRAAVKAEDRVSYDEPPDWFKPTRESLGGALLRAKRFAEAEAVFREDLEHFNPRNPRSQFGLVQALNGQGKDSTFVEREFAVGWGRADGPLSVDDL